MLACARSREDVRALDIDGVEIHKAFRPGDIVRASVVRVLRSVWRVFCRRLCRSVVCVSACVEIEAMSLSIVCFSCVRCLLCISRSRLVTRNPTFSLRRETNWASFWPTRPRASPWCLLVGNRWSAPSARRSSFAKLPNRRHDAAVPSTLSKRCHVRTGLYTTQFET